jgi:hypothetical protein
MPSCDIEGTFVANVRPVQCSLAEKIKLNAKITMQDRSFLHFLPSDNSSYFHEGFYIIAGL